MNFLLNILLMALLIASGLSSVIAAPIYTWQDEQGRTHFSDRPLNEDAQQLAEDYSIPPSEDAAQASEDSAQTSEQDQRPDPAQEQIDRFYQRRDAEREARLEEQRIRQLARDQQLQERRLSLEEERAGEPDTVIINSTPYYGYGTHRRRHYIDHRRDRDKLHKRHDHRRDGDKLHKRHHRRHGAVRVHSPYAKQLLRQNYPKPYHPNPSNRYPNYPLNFWKH